MVPVPPQENLRSVNGNMPPADTPCDFRALCDPTSMAPLPLVLGPQARWGPLEALPDPAATVLRARPALRVVPVDSGGNPVPPSPQAGPWLGHSRAPLPTGWTLARTFPGLPAQTQSTDTGGTTTLDFIHDQQRSQWFQTPDPAPAPAPALALCRARAVSSVSRLGLWLCGRHLLRAWSSVQLAGPGGGDGRGSLGGGAWAGWPGLEPAPQSKWVSS